ncbi:transposase, partial [Neisseria meningitidis]
MPPPKRPLHFLKNSNRYSGLTKIRTRRRAADSTNSTEPIHLVLQHLRES